MARIFREFWAYNIVNVIALILNETISIYSFIPYNKHDCGTHKPVKIATWSGATEEKIIDNERVKNMNGCEVNVTVVDLPPTVIFPNKESRNGSYELNGIEPAILKEIAKKLNFKPKFAVARDGQAWGWIEPEPHGVVGEVFQRKSYFGFALLASTLERYEYLDMSVPTSSDVECITWAVPLGAGKSRAPWINLLTTEFPLSVWCSMFATVSIAVLAFRTLGSHSEADRYIFRSRAETILYTFKSSLASTVKFPKAVPLRILCISWLWYSFIIVSVYQSSMGSKLTVPLRKPDINTFKDLVESDLHFTGLSNTFRLLAANPDKDVKTITERLEPTDYGITEAVDKIIFDRNIAYIRESTTFIYNTMINPKAKGMVHFMKQCVYDYYPQMVLQKKCALTKRVNKIIRSLHEAGLISKWRSKYIYKVPTTPPSVKRLSLKHMTGPFVILFIGIGGGVIAFLVEQVRYHFTVRRIVLHDEYVNTDLVV